MTTRSLCPIFLPLLAILLPGFAFAAPPTDLRILVTNDDGYKSAGLTALVAELAKIGTVVVSAPLKNRSGASHAIEIAAPISVKEVPIEGAQKAYAVDASPATAASWGITALGAERPIDVLVSGINRGANVGNVAHYSGTVGAAMEGVYRGIPSLAVSQDAAAGDYTVAARYTARLLRALHKRGFLDGIVLSINVPLTAITGHNAEVVAAPMGGSYLDLGRYTRLSEDGADSVWQADPGRAQEAPAGTDTADYLGGRITVTPLRFDWTDPDALAGLRAWLPAVD